MLPYLYFLFVHSISFRRPFDRKCSISLTYLQSHVIAHLFDIISQYHVGNIYHVVGLESSRQRIKLLLALFHTGNNVAFSRPRSLSTTYLVSDPCLFQIPVWQLLTLILYYDRFLPCTQPV